MSRQVPQLEGRLCADLPDKSLDEWFWAGNSTPKHKPVPATQELWDKAKKVCQACPIRAKCADIGMKEEYGVWGGLDQHERYNLRRHRRRPLTSYTAGERLALGKQVAFMRKGDRPLPWSVIEVHTGLNKEAGLTVLSEYVQAEKARRSKPPAPATPSVLNAALTIEQRREIIDLHQQGVAVNDIARRTGRVKSTIYRLIGEDNQQKAPFPPESPHGRDSWVRYQSMVVPAFYVAQTADASWYLMRVKHGRQPMTKWFAREDVRIDRPVGVAIRVRSNAKRAAS